MTNQLPRLLSDSKGARWAALLVVAFTMFAGYYLADVMAPLKGLLENQLTWNSSEYGFFTSAYGWFNVFLLFLIIGGIILDKMGVRFTGLGSAIVMVVGTAIKYWAVSTHDLDGTLLFGWKAQVMVAAIGYAIFGVGVEVAGITVSKIIVKWFRGKELALAMGLQLSIARLGTALALSTSLPIALYFRQVSAPVLICLIMLCIGLIAFFVYTFMDKKLDASIVTKNKGMDVAPDEEFKMKDILFIVKNKGWWYIAILCVLFYSAVFPFLKYATDLMINKFGVNENWAGALPGLLPFGTILLTPVFGSIYDRKGKGATIMIIGAILIILVHLLFSIPFFDHWLFAILLIVVLGIGFSLVPSAMWPSVPKIIPDHQLGTAYSLIFWVQNWGLMGVPLLIGWILEKFCFIGYFAIIGSGFITTQGDQVAKVMTQDKKEYVVTQGLISRDDKLFQITGFVNDDKGAIQKIISKNDTLPLEFISNYDVSSLDLISDKVYNREVKKHEVPMPVYSMEKGKKITKLFTKDGKEIPIFSKITSSYNYTLPMIIFMVFGLLALVFAFLLKAEDRKKGYGLELPNKKSDE